MSDQEGVEVERRHDNFFESLVKDMMPLQQRQLLGTLLVFATLVVVGWVGINEPRRMQTYTAQYDGRSIERGAVLYTDNCASCHGVDGRGIPSVAPALNAPDLFDGSRLAEVGYAGTVHDYVQLTVAAGRPVPTADWPAPMPTWSQEYGGPMRPDQVRDVVNFVMNYGRFYEEGAEDVPEVVIPTPEVEEEGPTDGAPGGEAVGSDPTAELPEGDAARGEALFNGTEMALDGAQLGCQSCHSTAGQVLVGPPVDEVEVPDGYDSLQAYIHESIVQPSAHVVPDFADVMPKNYGERLDAQSLADLIAYLESLNN